MLRAVEPHGAQVVRAMYSFGEYQLPEFILGPWKES